MSDPRQAACPCCLFPTLNENGGFDICIICWWEDDGQNDTDTDEVRGGPNSHYSLTDARNNFADHGHMYDKERGIPAVEHPSVARRELMDYLQSIGFDPQRAEAARLGELLDAEMDSPHNTARIRTFAGIAVILTIAAGVAVRRWPPWGFWSKYPGVALWSAAVYALVVFVRPRAGVIRCAALALLICWAVEFAQLTPVPGWLSSEHPILRMIFGEHFGLGDLPAYAIGVLLAAITHASTVRRRTER